jgi:Protein of unknown function (DUF2510)
MTELPLAGWYPDPSGPPGSLRWWDGSAWSNQTTLALKGFETPEPLPQQRPPWACYWEDLKTSARLLWASPFLVLLSAALFAALELGARRAPPRALWALAELAAGVFLVGFAGIERVWFVRKLRKARIQPGEVWALSWRFFWRFVRLGLFDAAH